jgi:hypothetical protein
MASFVTEAGRNIWKFPRPGWAVAPAQIIAQGLADAVAPLAC